MDDKDYNESWLNSFGYTYQKKCSCGCDKVWGESCNPEFHSEWCEKSPNYKPKNLSEDTYPSMFTKHYD